MKILLVTQYFWPETFIISDLVRCLVAEGHTIEVLTSKPNYPDGKIYSGYKAKGYVQEYYDGTILVHRVPLIPRGSGGAIRLALNYLSFVVSGLFYFHRIVQSQQFDVIFVFAVSPITSAIPAIYLKKRFKIPLVLWIQDLWPESLSATGFIRNKFILKLVGRLVHWIYSATDMLLLQSFAFQRPVSQYAHSQKMAYYPNSYLESSSCSADEAIIPNHILLEFERNFCLVFAGNIGRAQAVETIIAAAEQLQYLSDCKFVVVGSGSMSEWLEKQITEKGLINVILTGRFPPSVMPCIFRRAAGLLVTLKREEVFSYLIPSKVQACLASGRPVIAALDGEGARIIEMAKAGFVGPAEDVVALVKNIERLYHMSTSDRKKLGDSGRAYFMENFEMRNQSKQLIKIFEEIIK